MWCWHHKLGKTNLGQGYMVTPGERRHTFLWGKPGGRKMMEMEKKEKKIIKKSAVQPSLQPPLVASAALGLALLAIHGLIYSLLDPWEQSSLTMKDHRWRSSQWDWLGTERIFKNQGQKTMQVTLGLPFQCVFAQCPGLGGSDLRLWAQGAIAIQRMSKCQVPIARATGKLVKERN